VNESAGVTLLEVLLVLAILSFVAGLLTLSRLPDGTVSEADVERFVANAVIDTMKNGRDSLLYVHALGLRHDTGEIGWDASLGRADGFDDSEKPIVLYANGTSSAVLTFVGTGLPLQLLTVPRW
jgi:prepilin-type N-terminal cleavage/methylation domain-containing protein